MHRVDGLVNARRLTIAGVAVVAVVVGVAQLRQPADENLSGSTRVVPEPSQTTHDAGGLPEDVVSRGEAAPPEFQSRSGSAPELTQIGPKLDPEATGYAPSDGRSSHIGEHLDPDDDSVSNGNGKVSHIGEPLDPLADEPGALDG